MEKATSLPPTRGDGLRTLKTRLAIRAYHRAMHDLRDRHRAEFDHLLDLRRSEVGLYRDASDIQQISDDHRLTRQEATL